MDRELVSSTGRRKQKGNVGWEENAGSEESESKG